MIAIPLLLVYSIYLFVVLRLVRILCKRIGVFRGSSVLKVLLYVAAINGPWLDEILVGFQQRYYCERYAGITILREDLLMNGRLVSAPELRRVEEMKWTIRPIKKIYYYWRDDATREVVWETVGFSAEAGALRNWLFGFVRHEFADRCDLSSETNELKQKYNYVKRWKGRDE